LNIEPGDALVLKVVDIEPSLEQGWSCFVPNFVFLTHTHSSQVALMRVGNVVDTYYTMVIKFPKKYLPK
jgi:acetamidase/formamidase